MSVSCILGKKQFGKNTPRKLLNDAMHKWGFCYNGSAKDITS